MNVADLQQKLLAAARRDIPSDHVPYAFEKRIMAHVRACPAVDSLHQWASALWRATVPCVAVSVVLGAWAFLAAPTPGLNGDLSQDMDNTVLAAAEPEQAAE